MMRPASSIGLVLGGVVGDQLRVAELERVLDQPPPVAGGRVHRGIRVGGGERFADDVSVSVLVGVELHGQGVSFRRADAAAKDSSRARAGETMRLARRSTGSVSSSEPTTSTSGCSGLE